MPIFAITGGIATGKSTASKMLVGIFGCEAFDADAEARHLLDSDSRVHAELDRIFGKDAFTPDGLPDRAWIRESVFSDPKKRAALEQILHPRIRARWVALAQSARSKHRNFLADIPLLYETSAETFFDEVVVVAASTETQLHRIRARGVDGRTARAIIEAQFPIRDKVRKADRVIWNDGSLATLEAQIRLLSEIILAPPPSRL